MKRWVWLLTIGAAMASAGNSRTARASDGVVEVPQSTVGDMMALSPAERSAFIKGFITALAGAHVGDPACLVKWYYEMGGVAKLEKNLAAQTAPQSGGGDGRPPPSFYKAQPMAMAVQMAAFDYCANKK